MPQRALTQTTFDSPFSKRLNLKAGSGLIKSQSLPTPTSSKDKGKEKAPPPGKVAGEPLFLPEPVADEVGGAQAPPAVEQKSVTDEADTQEERRIPANDKSQSLPIPATSEDNEKLPEPGRTAGEKLSQPKPLPITDEVEAAKASPAGPEKSRMDEAETEGEARKPAEDTDISDKSRSMEKLDQMDIDEGESPERSKEKQREKPVVLDTTQAAWGRKKTAPVPEKESDDLAEPDGASEEPATKKRRVEVEDARTDANTSASKPARKPPSKSGAGMTSLDSLRNRLAGFARGGLLATATSSKKEPPARDEEMEAEDVEGAEEGRTFSKNVRKGRDRKPSFEIIGPRIKTIVLREEQRPAGDVDKTRTRSDSDTVMENTIPSISSTTAPPEHHPASKVIEMIDEQDLASETSTKQSGQRPEIIRGSDTASGNVTLRFDIERLTSAWTRLRNQVVGAGGAPCVASKVSADAGVANTEDNESATRALARVIDKADFVNMDIIGQFNLGFIIVRRQKAAACDDGGEGDQMDDLFIVDQHASDEKYNFETLQQTTRIQSQKLFRCVRLTYSRRR
jgi:DNA mismatch repair protein PMS2